MAEKEQIEQMVTFIQNEAKEKAADLDARAEEEAAEARTKMINAEKPKIKDELEARKQRMIVDGQIKRSRAVNLQRIEKIKSRQEMLEKIRETCKDSLGSSATDEKFLAGLIAEGLLMLLEKEVEVVCRKKDAAVVQKSFAEAQKMYTTTIKKDAEVDVGAPQLTLSKQELPESSLGGVILTCGGGAISIDNTLETRLSLTFEQGMKDIRKKLFKN